MRKDNKYNHAGPSAEDRALEKFADMLILCCRHHKIIYVVHFFMSVSFIFSYVLGCY